MQKPHPDDGAREEAFAKLMELQEAGCTKMPPLPEQSTASVMERDGSQTSQLERLINDTPQGQALVELQLSQAYGSIMVTPAFYDMVTKGSRIQVRLRKKDLIRQLKKQARGKA